jgi:hypothetical protein
LLLLLLLPDIHRHRRSPSSSLVHFPSPLSDGTAALRRQKETEEFLFASVALLKVALLTKLDILNSMLHPWIHPSLLPSSSNNSLAAAAVAAAH